MLGVGLDPLARNVLILAVIALFVQWVDVGNSRIAIAVGDPMTVSVSDRNEGAQFQMSRATPRLRNLAKLIIASDASENKPFADSTPQSFPVHEKLYPHLEALIGKGGFRALLWRARVLATAELPWLGSVQVTVDGSLEAEGEIRSQLDPDEFLEGRVILLAQLLGLLEAFIGENLTMRLVRDACPEVSNSDLNEGFANE